MEMPAAFRVWRIEERQPVSDLSFFTHHVDGFDYAGWYRVLDGDRV
jgi:hypothetical protein